MYVYIDRHIEIYMYMCICIYTHTHLSIYLSIYMYMYMPLTGPLRVRVCWPDLVRLGAAKKKKVSPNP